MISRLFSPEQKLSRYLLCVIAPSLLALAYLGLLASDGYVSRALVLVEQDSPLAAPEIALGILSVGGGPTKQDALVVESFMQSRAMLDDLNAQLDLFAHFSSAEVDWFSRLDPEASTEDFLAYYRDRLRLAVDEESYILSIEFVAFDPEFARRVTERLVTRSEEFVNEVSHYLAREQLAFIQGEVDRANQQLKRASREMIALQRQNDVFSPERETEAVGEILAGLEVELARQRTELKALTGYLNPDAPEMVATRGRIAALEQQAVQERARLVGSAESGLNDLMLTYQDAEVGVKLAAEVYKTALISLETTRLDAARKVKYLVSVDRPSLPDSAEQPRVWYWTLSVFVFLNLAYFVASLVFATIQDHRE